MTDTSSQPTGDNCEVEKNAEKVEQNGQTEECQMDTTEAKPKLGHAIVAGERKDFEEKKIFIGDIDSKTTSDDLKQYFAKYGEVTNVDVKSSGKKSKILRFGFISFTEHSSVEEILKSLPHKIKDKEVTVKQALMKPSLKKICVIGLDKNIKEEQIKAYFEKYGKIEAILIPTGEGENITITYENEAMAAEAAKETTHTIESSTCTVQKAELVKKQKPRKKQKYYYVPGKGGRIDLGRGGYYGRGNGPMNRFPMNNGPPGWGRGGPRGPGGYNDYPPPRYGGPGGGPGYGNRMGGPGGYRPPRPNYGGPSNYGGPGPNYGGPGPNYGGGPGNYQGRPPYNEGGQGNYGGPQGYNEGGYNEQPSYRPSGGGYNDGNYGDAPNYGGGRPGGYGNDSNYERGNNYGSGPGNYGGGRPNYGNGGANRPGGNYGGDKQPRMGNYNQEPSSYGKARPMRGGMAFHPYEY